MDILKDFGLFNDPNAELFDLIDINPDLGYNLIGRINHFDQWNDEEFFDRFRLAKSTVTFILKQIEEELRNRPEQNINGAISTLDRLLLTLRFLATGDFYATLADFIGIPKITAGTIIKQGITALCKLFPRYVHLPKTKETQLEERVDFYKISSLPAVIGAVSCTHVKISLPAGAEADIFRNRKGNTSLKCQVTCNAKLKITDLVCRWPGSVNDNHIFEKSRLKRRLQNGEMGNGLLVAGRGYTVQPYIFTTVDEPQNEAEKLFNESLIKTKNVIGRLLYVWKKRFAILTNGIKCKMEITQMMVVACAVLHNIALEQNEKYFEDDGDEKLFEEDISPEGQSARQNIINNYFRNFR